MTRRELVKDGEVGDDDDDDEVERDLRRRAKEVIASATFFFFSKRLRERRVGRSLDRRTDCIRNCRQKEEGHHQE